MEKEIKITLVPKEQTEKEYDNVCITCGNVCAWGDCLEVAIPLKLCQHGEVVTPN